MRRILPFVFASACLLLLACASSGNVQLQQASKDDLLAQIQEGTTTKAQVEALLGPPDEVSFTENLNEIWTYRHKTATPHASSFIPIVRAFSSGHDVQTKELIVVFKEGVVAARTMRESTSVQKAGLLGKS